MKKLLYICGITVLVMLASCRNSDEPDDPSAGGDIYSYSLAIKFVNQAGDNILQHIECKKGDRVKFTEEYKYTRCTYEEKPDFHEALPLFIISDGAQNYLRLWIDPYPSTGFYPTIISNLTCKYIYGDDEPREFVSTWKKGTGYVTDCIKLVYEGKEWPVSFNKELDSYVATITVTK